MVYFMRGKSIAAHAILLNIAWDLNLLNLMMNLFWRASPHYQKKKKLLLDSLANVLLYGLFKVSYSIEASIEADIKAVTASHICL